MERHKELTLSWLLNPGILSYSCGRSLIPFALSAVKEVLRRERGMGGTKVCCVRIARGVRSVALRCTALRCVACCVCRMCCMLRAL